MMKKLLLLGLGLWTFNDLNAQVAGYSFKYEAGNFMSINSYPGAVVTNHTVQDDRITPEKIAIPFPFSFGGQAMDSVSIHENGYLWFGNVTAWYMVDTWPISAMHVSAVKGVISALGIDLDPVTGMTTVKTTTVGTSPSRVLIAEWMHTSTKAAKSDPAGRDDIGFQIRLYEADKRIEISYGYIGLNRNISSDVEIGIKGATYSDFTNREIPAGGNWASTVAGNAQTDRIRFAENFKPVIGALMTWTPGATTGVSGKGTNKQVQLYPNPAGNELFVKDLPAGYDHPDYTIHDITGRTVAEGRLAGNRISLAGMPSGTYLLLVRSGSNELKQLFTKKD